MYMSTLWSSTLLVTKTYPNPSFSVAAASDIFGHNYVAFVRCLTLLYGLSVMPSDQRCAESGEPGTW